MFSFKGIWYVLLQVKNQIKKFDKIYYEITILLDSEISANKTCKPALHYPFN